MKALVAGARLSVNQHCQGYLKRQAPFFVTGVLTLSLLTAVFSQITLSTVNASSDLSLTKSSLSDPALAGESLTYSIRVTNSGPSDALNVVITEAYESGFIFSSSTPSADRGKTNQWTFKTIKAGETKSISLTGKVKSSSLGSFSNRVTLASSTPDPDPKNNQVSLTSSVTTLANLSITKSSLSDPVFAGETLTYSIRVTNSGPSDALNVVITETYDANFIFSRSSPSPDPGTTNQWTFKTIKVGETKTIRVTGTVDPSTVGSLSNAVSLTSDTADPNVTNNTARFRSHILKWNR